MTGKTVDQYRQVIQHLKQRVRHVSGHRRRPDMMVCDFEQGLILAIETALPNTMPLYSQSNDEESYYILKTNNSFLF